MLRLELLYQYRYQYQGEANELAPGANSNKQQDWPAELVSEQVEDTPIQTLQSQPFFERVVSPTDEEKIRVSVHNYTRAIKRNRGTRLFSSFPPSASSL